MYSSGNYLDNLRASYPQSDTDTIRTEDFEKKFKSAMVYNSGKLGGEEQRSIKRKRDWGGGDFLYKLEKKAQRERKRKERKERGLKGKKESNFKGILKRARGE